MTKVKSKNKKKIPLKRRFHAWWEGYDAYAEMGDNGELGDEEKEAETASEKPEEPKEKFPECVIDQGFVCIQPGKPPPYLEFSYNTHGDDLWDTKSLDISEAMWGEGFLHPGGAALAEEATEIFSFEEGKISLDLTAGLGGVAYLFSTKGKAPIFGVDTAPILTDAANKRMEDRGLAERIKFTCYEPEEFEPQQKYDNIYVREFLYRMPNKFSFMEAIARAARKDAEVILYDYVTKDNSDPTKLADWMEIEPIECYTISVGQNEKSLACGGLELIDARDETKKHSKHILEGVVALHKRLAKDDVSEEMKLAASKEIDLWEQRYDALQNGLCFMRYHLKKG